MYDEKVNFKFGLLTFFKKIDKTIYFDEHDFSMRNPKTEEEIRFAYTTIRKALMAHNFLSTRLEYEDFDKNALHKQVTYDLKRFIGTKSKSIDQVIMDLARTILLIEPGIEFDIDVYRQYLDFINFIKRNDDKHLYWDIVFISQYADNGMNIFERRLNRFGYEIQFGGNKRYSINGVDKYDLHLSDSYDRFIKRLYNYLPYLNDLKENKYPRSEIVRKLSTMVDGWHMQSHIVEVISIIESLLTHNPNDHIYHIENSINRQFRSKMLTVIYMINGDINFQFEKFILNELYSYRSKVAHGEQSSYKLDKFMGSLNNYKNLVPDRYNIYVSILNESNLDTLFEYIAKEYILMLLDFQMKHSEFMEELKLI